MFMEELFAGHIEDLMGVDGSLNWNKRIYVVCRKDLWAKG